MDSRTESDITIHVRDAEDMREARNEFVRVVGNVVDQLVNGHGFSRDRASSLVLREIATNTLTPPTEEELGRVKQHYRLAHYQATRALAVSAAFKRIVQNESLSHTEAVRRLTQRLLSANFILDSNFSHVDDSTVTVTESANIARKASEISIPQIPKQQQLAADRRLQSPAKRAKSTSSKCIAKPMNKASRKRSIEEIGSGNHQSTDESEQPSSEPRLRADSVTDAVSVKMHQQEPCINAEKPPTRKRARGGSSSLDDAEAGPVVKRPRPDGIE